MNRDRRSLSFVAALVLTLHFAPPSRGNLVTLRPVADASLMGAAPNNNNGGEAWILAGTTQNYTLTRGLLRFDFAGVIPSGAVIDSVSLALEVTRQPSDGYNPAPFGLHQVLQSWGEGVHFAADNRGGMGAPALPFETTWNHRFAFTAQTWAAPGGLAGVDFEPEPSSSQFIYGVGDSPYTFASTEMLVADVQSWADDPASNFGWMLLCGTEDINFTARRFGSREDLDRAPILTVEFTVVPEPGTGVLMVVGLAGLAAARRRKR